MLCDQENKLLEQDKVQSKQQKIKEKEKKLAQQQKLIDEQRKAAEQSLDQAVSTSSSDSTDQTDGSSTTKDESHGPSEAERLLREQGLFISQRDRKKFLSSSGGSREGLDTAYEPNNDWVINLKARQRSETKIHEREKKKEELRMKQSKHDLLVRAKAAGMYDHVASLIDDMNAKDITDFNRKITQKLQIESLEKKIKINPVEVLKKEKDQKAFPKIKDFSKEDKFFRF